MADMEATCRIRMKVPEAYQHPQGGIMLNEYALFIQDLLSSVNGKMVQLQVEKELRLQKVKAQ
jgi:hypothetical protein